MPADRCDELEAIFNSLRNSPGTTVFFSSPFRSNYDQLRSFSTFEARGCLRVRVRERSDSLEGRNRVQNLISTRLRTRQATLDRREAFVVTELCGCCNWEQVDFVFPAHSHCASNWKSLKNFVFKPESQVRPSLPYFHFVGINLPGRTRCPADT